MKDVAFLKSIQSSSSNGNVYVVELDGRPAIMKSMRPRDDKIPDSLAYEYFVGKFINNYVRVFPCFVETYEIAQADAVTTSLHRGMFRKVTERDVCKNPMSIVLFTEYVDHAKPLKYIEAPSMEMVHILFQVYMPLAFLSKDFTHYDLHRSNVMVQTTRYYTQFIYHLPGRVVKFKTRYIAKIIDYGKCFVRGNRDFFKKFKCDAGFNCNKTVRAASKRSFSTCRVANPSSDLRLFMQVQDKVPIASIPVVYDRVRKPNYKQHYGTAPASDDFPNSVQTVVDAMLELERRVKDQPHEVGATFHIYSDGRPFTHRLYGKD